MESHHRKPFFKNPLEAILVRTMLYGSSVVAVVASLQSPEVTSTHTLKVAAVEALLIFAGSKVPTLDQLQTRQDLGSMYFPPLES